jgi:hypothetical protein
LKKVRTGFPEAIEWEESGEEHKSWQTEGWQLSAAQTLQPCKLGSLDGSVGWLTCCWLGDHFQLLPAKRVSYAVFGVTH